MDYSKATNQELFEIAFDQSARMRDRYAATKELQERSKSMVGTKCKYPGCSEASTKSWALVPLCEEHHGLIKEETSKYYKKSSGFLYDYRNHYHKISHLIPWSRKE